jgi:hypothetical protein
MKLGSIYCADYSPLRSDQNDGCHGENREKSPGNEDPRPPDRTSPLQSQDPHVTITRGTDGRVGRFEIWGVVHDSGITEAKKFCTKHVMTH